MLTVAIRSIVVALSFAAIALPASVRTTASGGRCAARQAAAMRDRRIGRRRIRASKSLWAATLLGACGLAAPEGAHAVLLLYEPFGYAAGTVLDGTPATGQNLSGNFTALGTAPQQKLTVTSPSLDYGSLNGTPAASGLRISDTLGVTAAGASVSLAQPIGIAPGETIYWSALLTLDDRLNGNHFANITLTDDATGDFLVFGEPVVGVGGLRVAASTQATGELVADGTDNAFTDGNTVLLIGRYFNSAAPGGDLLQLVSYDTTLAAMLPSSFDPLDPNAGNSYTVEGLDIDLERISSITFTIRGLDNNFIDELRIGTTYASVAVVPLPAAGWFMLTAMAAILGVGARRRRDPPYSGS